eukprot:gene491-biopygen413
MPTYEKKDLVLASVRRNRVTVISGDTGCGKSTLIPQLICDAVDLIPDDKVIVCTQPRRVAAITLPEYVAKDRGQTMGKEVGYQIRFVNEFCEETRLIYATTAIVLRRLHQEPNLDMVGCLIVDEVQTHNFSFLGFFVVDAVPERDVYTDFLLLIIRQRMKEGKMKHLKLVLMSATLNADDFADYFEKVNGAGALRPVHIPGRMFKVCVVLLKDGDTYWLRLIKVYDYYWEDACEWLSFCPPAKGKGKGKGGKKGKGRANNEGAAGEEIQAATAAGTAKPPRLEEHERKVLLQALRNDMRKRLCSSGIMVPSRSHAAAGSRKQ